jgi:ATP-dependent DNA ligase
MAKKDLIKKAIDLGIEVPEKAKSDEIMDLLRDVLCVGKHIVTQIEPMLCADAKDFIDYDLDKPWLSSEMDDKFWDNPQWLAEEKLDGCRMKMHITPDGIRFDSRRRSDKDYAYKERTDNFPQFKLEDEVYKELFSIFGNVVFDGEMLMPVSSIDTGSVVTKGTCNTTVAVTNSDPETSIPLQKKFGWCQFKVFDVVSFANFAITTGSPFANDSTYKCRRAYVKSFVKYAELVGLPVSLPKFAIENKAEFFEAIVKDGGEGIVLKDMDGLYEEGKRSKYMYKLKKFNTADCFITGWTPGEKKHTGKVGAVLISVMRNVNGQMEEVEVGAVGAWTNEMRDDMTAPDGSLKEEYYEKVMEVRYQEITKNNKLRHAVIKQWRPDKSMCDCDGVDIFGS